MRRFKNAFILWDIITSWSLSVRSKFSLGGGGGVVDGEGVAMKDA